MQEINRTFVIRRNLIVNPQRVALIAVNPLSGSTIQWCVLNNHIIFYFPITVTNPGNPETKAWWV